MAFSYITYCEYLLWVDGSWYPYVPPLDEEQWFLAPPDDACSATATTLVYSNGWSDWDIANVDDIQDMIID